MNYIKATDEQPTLLSLDEVRKLFHELGHLLHALFTRVKYASLHPRRPRLRGSTQHDARAILLGGASYKRAVIPLFTHQP